MPDLSTKYTKIKRALFDKVYSQYLNPEQMRAVFCARGPLLVLAGAGSGKTTVLVNRIAYLIKYGNAYNSEYIANTVTEDTVAALEALLPLSAAEIEPVLSGFATGACKPHSVLAITFTNKAAKEIKGRLERTFNDREVSDAIWAGTFHSVCVRILRKFGSRLGYIDGFSIYDTDDKRRMIVSCMKELGIDEKRLNPRVCANAISMSKDKLVGASDFEITNDPRSKDIKRVFELYEKKMMDSAALDFDDLIMKTVDLLQRDSEVRDYYQNKFFHVLVDEYQDTNYAQFVLTELLCGKYRNIMVVGDDDQSIYRFRGATVENILGFDTTYPDATVIKLEQNYRSTENILSAANSVISHNQIRHDKRLWCKRGEGEKITLRECEDAISEGKYIIDTITKSVRNDGAKYSDFAILYRINELARSLETVFAKSGVPYRILGGQRFYDRKEIKDMVAYLSLINSKQDNLRLKRIINEPKRKIGDATVEAIERIALSEGVCMYDILGRAEQYTALAKSAPKLRAFYELIEGLKPLVHSPAQLIGDLFERSGYREMLKSEGFEGEGKIDNINELIAGAIEYEVRMEDVDDGRGATLAGFLEEISLVSDIDKYDENADAVVMMTIHSAKGLEFPTVFISGMEDGIFPSEQNIMSEVEMGEERRLCYVAITRAKNKLYITYTKNRTMYGRTSYNILSSFIRKEVPEELLIKEGGYRTSSLEYRRSYGGGYNSSYNKSGGASGGFGYGNGYKKSELSRSPAGIGAAKPKSATASSFGVKKFEAGTRVRHTAFGEGVILSAKDLGGDVLYEVKFASVGVKKLMATYARLTKI